MTTTYHWIIDAAQGYLILTAYSPSLISYHSDHYLPLCFCHLTFTHIKPHLLKQLVPISLEPQCTLYKTHNPTQLSVACNPGDIVFSSINWIINIYFVNRQYPSSEPCCGPLIVCSCLPLGKESFFPNQILVCQPIYAWLCFTFNLMCFDFVL